MSIFYVIIFWWKIYSPMFFFFCLLSRPTHVVKAEKKELTHFRRPCIFHAAPPFLSWLWTDNRPFSTLHKFQIVFSNTSSQRGRKETNVSLPPPQPYVSISDSHHNASCTLLRNGDFKDDSLGTSLWFAGAPLCFPIMLGGSKVSGGIKMEWVLWNIVFSGIYLVYLNFNLLKLASKLVCWPIKHYLPMSRNTYLYWK